MKPVCLSVILVLLSGVCFGQTNADKVEFKVQLGLKYTPLEYRGGPSIGTMVMFPNGMNVSLRKDYLIGMGTRDNGLSYVITYYRTYNYLDVGYSLLNDKLTLGGGGGWIYKGKGNNYFLTKDAGYFSFTVYASTQISLFNFELRGDVPLGGNQRIINRGYLFPISACLGYRFPRKTD